MKKKLLDYIVCPECNKDLKLKILKKDKEVLSGVLNCENNHYFPVIKGIPRMLNQELQKKIIYPKHKPFFLKYKKHFPKVTKKNLKNTDNKSKTAEIFGYEWKNFPELHKIYEEQFEEWTSPIKKEFFKDKFILDAGCGTGRHIYYSKKYGAKEIIGVDLSQAVEVAYENNKDKNVHIVQADIYNLPFKQNIFDFIYSIGVLHHLPNPKKGFKNLIQYLKKQGRIAIWVYGQPTALLKYIIDPLRKNIISKLPGPIIKAIAFINTLLVYAISKFIYKPINNFKNISKYLPMNYTFNYFSKFNFKILYSMMYDITSPPNQFYLTKKDMDDWFSTDKLEKTQIVKHEHSWSCNAYKS